MRSPLYIVLVSMALSCHQKGEENTYDARIAVPPVPTVVITSNDPELDKMADGRVYYRHEPFSGYVATNDARGAVRSKQGYVDGVKHGTFTEWFPNGQKAVQRYYLNGKKHGHHTAWHTNGRQKFDYTFSHGKSVGIHRQWYDNGVLSQEFNYVDGQQRGRQRVWRKDGKFRANFFVDQKGRRFGLQGLKRCKNVDVIKEELAPLTVSK